MNGSQWDRWSPSSWQPSVEGAQPRPRSVQKVPSGQLAAFLMGQLAAWGLASGALVVRADQETSLTTLLDEIKARRPETLVERTAVESHQSIGAVERMNRHHKVQGESVRPHCIRAHQAKRWYSGAIVEFGEIVWARIATVKKLGKLDQRWVEVFWAGKAEGSDEHIGLDHRGARRFRAVRREPEISRWVREVILEVAGCPWDMRPVGRTSPPDAFSRVAVFGDHAPAAQSAGTAAAEAETSDLLKRKDGSSIRRDRTPSFFTTQSQLVVSRRLS